MIYLIFAVILLAFPFLLLGVFKDKKVGFVYTLFFWIVFQAFCAIIAQAMGIFYFWVIFPANFFADCAVAFFIFKNRNKWQIKIDWAAVFVVLISFLCLLQVHYNYTGKASFTSDESVFYHDVKNMVYPYPYFSDEWDSVLMMDYSIDSHKLPLQNPLDKSFYINFAVPFFSFLSSLALFLKTSPLLSFNFFSIFANISIILAGYIFLRINRLDKPVSAITALSLLFIACGANLPGFWHLIPVHFGILFSLLGFCFLSSRKKTMAILSGFMVLLFYPPMILFYGLALAVFLFSKKYVFYSGLALATVVAAVFVFSIISLALPGGGIISALVFRLFYPSFTGNFIPQYNFYDIIPFFSVLFFFFGVYYVFKNMKWLFSQLVLGIGFWILYSFVAYRIIIDYERIVFFTSIIIVLISGFGLKLVLESRHVALKCLKPALLAFFILAALFYTQQSNWQRFILINRADGSKAYPKAPANRYLMEEDVKIFDGIVQKKFLSVPWKGLVISAATRNFPIVAKDGIISTGNQKIASQFLKADCQGKTAIAKNQELDYIYLYPFDCQGFEKQAQSEEGFALYRVLH